MFGVNISMGTPAVNGIFLLSDILSSIYVPSIDCYNCQMAGVIPFYNPNDSSSYVFGANVTFGNDTDTNDNPPPPQPQPQPHPHGRKLQGGSSSGNWNYGKGEITSGFHGNGTMGYEEICMNGFTDGSASSSLCVPDT
jgi:hypothetical protein